MRYNFDAPVRAGEIRYVYNVIIGKTMPEKIAKTTKMNS
ncbi:hypothetical protein BWQ96_09665 [Gracilariopsis chorda]|uniref:Uncharacterized protein n=1 Tax=Gracilariopsis chorda TaxID=448386 RepID=A0A2V3IEY9_9FLOR|nr:hypothetical protein BWQ96_09665 [Gracilariopsis chorda]|eukprot:PXF40634.1 hypothetical protein BWQ96_09665 [Gracilariopsis chorda]